MINREGLLKDLAKYIRYRDWYNLGPNELHKIKIKIQSIKEQLEVSK